MNAIYRAVYLEEWVRVRNPRNSRFFLACGSCSICQACRCGPAWHSIRTGEVRCLKCFDAEAEHYGREDARAACRRAQQGAAP
jgi:hypothetical protein